MKTCTKCGVGKPQSGFLVRSSGRVERICRECNKVACAARHATHRADANRKRAAWTAANPEREAARNAAWKKAHPEAVKAISAGWVERNAEQHAAACSRWKKANPGKVASYTRYRQAAQLRATPAWANEFFIEEIYDLAARRTKATGFPWHVDHIVPLRSPLVSGLHVEHNLRVIPAVENIAKGNRHWPGMP